MIAGVRQFKLINGNGTEYDMTRPDALLHAPDGLGWGTERTVNRLGMTYIGINEKEIHQSPSGEMVFRTYEEYGRFLSFCQQGGLVLCYKPLDTWYYCEALISIQKSEIEWENNHLICPVQFTLLSYWYEKVVAQTAEPPEPAEPNYATVTGDPAVFNARYSYPIKDLSVAIQGTQDLNGYDKPWVGGRGKNLFNQNAFTWGTSQNIIYTHYAVQNGTYTMSTNYPAISGRLANMFFARGQITSGVTSGRDGVYINHPITIEVTDGYYTIATRKYTNADPAGSAYNWQIEKGSTATDWTPYENICPITSFTSVNITQTGSQTNTYEVELTGAGQVYKGTLDVTTGELVVEYIAKTITSFNGAWGSLTNGYGVYYTDDHGLTHDPAVMDVSQLVSNAFSYSANGRNSMPLGTYGGQDGALYTMTFILPSSITSLAEANTWLSSLSEPLVCTFALATPQTYTLTPVQLSNLIGSNTIEADAGEVTVTYRTDARTEYKIYPYQYSYKYGDTAQNVFDISCDLPSYFKLTVFGEATNPSWRVVQNGSIVKSGKINATIGSSQKLVINTDPKQTEIALYTLSNTRINNLYGYSDFATERIFALPQGESQVQVLTEDEQPPKVMIEVLKHV